MFGPVGMTAFYRVDLADTLVMSEAL